MEEEKDKTIRLSLKTWRRINSRRGIDGCNTFEEVIIKLLDDEEKGQDKVSI